jgi:hypothetical protein
MTAMDISMEATIPVEAEVKRSLDVLDKGIFGFISVDPYTGVSGKDTFTLKYNFESIPIFLEPLPTPPGQP